MVLINALNDNFKQTTAGLNPLFIWVVRLVLLGIAIAGIMLIVNLIINGAPARISY